MQGVGGGDTAAAEGLKKGPWTAAEDAILAEYVKAHGEGKWNAVQRNSGLLRCGKSCRLRWANHLRPDLKKGSFSPEEELIVLRLHAQIGNKWARMAAQLPGRTDNEIKNYWNTRLKRRRRAGLSPYPPEPPLYHHDQGGVLSVEPELPSSQIFAGPLAGSGAGGGIFDALLGRDHWWGPFGIGGGSALNSIGKLGGSDLGFGIKAETADISTLLDMIPAAAAPESYNSPEGPSSSSADHDDIGLEMQHLASAPINPAVDWESGSWNNLPGIYL